MQIVGRIGVASPQNELNYLALEAFAWNPRLDHDDWIDRNLALLLGGPKLSRRYYAMVRNETRDPDEITRDRDEARRIAQVTTDPRHARRWKNLAAELDRRLGLLR